MGAGSVFAGILRSPEELIEAFFNAWRRLTDAREPMFVLGAFAPSVANALVAIIMVFIFSEHWVNLADNLTTNRNPLPVTY
ncbi:MAG TPA: hypothetical protein PLY93_06335 [Turneriella sp.]|nr:hypothetical protein [Turneriella sp.]